MFDELGGGSVAGVPEWSKGAHSRCAAKCFVGSNPTSGIYQADNEICEFQIVVILIFIDISDGIQS